MSIFKEVSVLFICFLFFSENPDLLRLQQEKNDKLHSMLTGIVVEPEKVGEVSHAEIYMFGGLLCLFKYQQCLDLGYQWLPVHSSHQMCST